MARYVKRGKVWQYELSIKEANGKYKKIRKSGFRTKSEAIAEASSLESKIKQGFKVNSKNTLLSEAFLEWMEIFKKGKIESSTYKTYFSTLAYINKFFAAYTVKEMDRVKYQIGINKASETLSNGTIKNFNRQLRSCVKFLVDEGIIQSDFTQKVSIKGQKVIKENHVKFLNYSEFELFITSLKKQIDPSNTYPITFYIGAMTGMRYSEITGLTWDNIDFDNDVIKVRKTWRYDEKGFGPTKNESSVRDIVIDGSTKMILWRYKHRQEKLFQDLELTNPNPDNLVYWHPRRGIIVISEANKALKQFCNEIGLDHHITSHGLRHTHASVLLYKRVNIMTISKRLGHANISITLDTYSHILKELEKIENKEVKNIFSKINKDIKFGTNLAQQRKKERNR